MRKATYEHFDGSSLFGEDLTEDEVVEWFSDEAEAYHTLYAGKPTYQYEYDELNRIHGFSQVPTQSFSSVLGLGSAFGHELLPLMGHTDSFTIVESSRAYREGSPLGDNVTWLDARPDGHIQTANSVHDLAVCLGVLHHIPNVSSVIQELARVVRPGGYILLREPIISMGDFNKPRAGLTPHERGIPIDLLRLWCRGAGLEIVRETMCFFTPIARLAGHLFARPYNHKSVVYIDRWTSRLSRRLYKYHATSALDRIRPTAVFMVLRRASTPGS